MTPKASIPLMVAAFAAAAVLIVQPAAQASLPGYWDSTIKMKLKGREPMLISYNGQLFSIFQTRTELVDLGVNQSGRRADLYFRTYNGTDWTAPFNLTISTLDTDGHGIHGPRAVEYRGKLYLTAETVEPSLKDDDQETDYDIVMRVYDGRMWDPQPMLPMHVISGWRDGNISDTECRPMVFGDKLYLVWTQVPVSDGGTSSGFARIVYRTFDGTSWSPVSVIASDNTSIYGNSALAVLGDRLYLAFVSNMTAAADQDILVCYDTGGGWSVPARINPVVAGSPVLRINMNPRMLAYQDKLWLVWQSADPIAKSSTDYDILASAFNGTAWSYPVELNLPSDNGHDITPVLEVSRGTLYVAWTSYDPGTTDGGETADIVLRSFDGAGWGQITLVSPYGDNGTISGDHNPGDDITPWLCDWNNCLFCTWLSYDQNGVGHKGGNPSVIVRQVTNRNDHNQTPEEPLNATVSPGGGNDMRIPLAIIGVTAGVGAAAAMAVPAALKKRGKAGSGGDEEQ